MPVNGSLEWSVPYHPGVLKALGYKNGVLAVSEQVETAGAPTQIALTPFASALKGNGTDATVIEVRILDQQGRLVPTADCLVNFSMTGPGRFIAVGNGDPSSHDPSKFVDTIESSQIKDWKMRILQPGEGLPRAGRGGDAQEWQSVLSALDQQYPGKKAVFRSNVTVAKDLAGTIMLLLPQLGENAEVWFNGRQVAVGFELGANSAPIALKPSDVKKGANEIEVVADPFPKPPRSFDYTSPGSLHVVAPASGWQGHTFNGLAAIFIQSTGPDGKMTVSADAPGLESCRQTILAQSNN
jgi:beta-galactosidase